MTPMKILDPQSAVLSTLEVHQFLKENPPRSSAPKVGSYPAVDLKNHGNIRQDVSESRVVYAAALSRERFLMSLVVGEIFRDHYSLRGRSEMS